METRSIDFLFLGAGEGGSRLAFGGGGPNAFVINTAKEDLAGIDLPDSHKLLLGSGGGTGKDPEYIRKEFSQNIKMQKDLSDFIDKNLSSSELVWVCVGGGGGTGSGTCEHIIRALVNKNIPTALIYTLPESFSDALLQKNAISVFQRVYQEFAIDGSVSPCILVDNDKVRSRFNVSIDKAYKSMNAYICGSIEVFNVFSSKPSKIVSAIDKNDLSRLLGAGGCATIQHFIIDDLNHKQSVKEGFGTDIFVDGYDLTTSKAAGIIIIGSDELYADPRSTEFINYVFQTFSESLDNPGVIFKGVYTGRADKKLEIRTFVNGLAFPKAKFDELFELTRQGVTRALRKSNRIDSIGYDLDGASALDTNKSSQNRRSRTPGQSPPQEVVKKREKLKRCHNCILDPENGSGTGKFNEETGTERFEGNCPVCNNRGSISSN